MHKRDSKGRWPIIIEDDLWHVHRCLVTSAIVIPTNGSVNVDGHAIMGKGLAVDAANKFKSLRRELGHFLTYGPNCVRYFPQYHLITFPTKEYYYKKSTLKLIRRSCQELVKLIEDEQLTCVYVPMVGCGHGGLEWDDVQAILLEELPSETCVIIKKER